MKKIVLILSIIFLTACSSASEKPEADAGPIAVEDQPRNLCVDHGGGISMHIHPGLRIFITGEQIPIPANLGITDECMKAIHTHDGTGKIHLEYPRRHAFTLGEFFANWEKPFSENQILDKSADFARGIAMTVNGKENSEYENLILKDLQDIVIRYE